MPTLYLVATPIGNLEDVTLRALRVLREASLVCAEDTRVTRKLLAHYDIRARLLSYNEHNMKARTPRVLAALAEGDVALVSDAGTPGVSDPGYELTTAAIEAGFDVVPVPGPSALLAATAASGLPMREFTFVGFLPRRAVERQRLFDSLKTDPRPLVAFESPHRVRRALADMLAAWGDRRVAVCRELTKVFEEVFRGRISEAIERFTEPRGEFTLVVEGAAPVRPAASENDVREELRRLKAEGARGREAVRRVSQETGLPHRDVYRMWVEAGRGSNRAMEQ